MPNAPRIERLPTDALLTAIVESSDDAIASKTLDGIVTSWNRAAERLFGYAAAEMIGQPIAILAAPGREDEMPAILERIRRGEQVDHYETVRRRKDGTLVEIALTVSPVRDAAGRIVGASKIAREITDRKRHEALLREREQHFQKLLEVLPAAIYTTDAAGRITFYNEAAVALWGSRPQLGKDQWCGSWRLYWPDGRPMPHDQCPMAVALRENRPVRGAEALAERPDGTRVPFIPYPTPLRDASGALVGAVNMLVDITDRKQAEECKQAEQGLRRAKEAAERANATKSRFLAAASHDLRQPLQALDLQRAVLARRVSGPEARQTLHELGLSIDVMRNTLDALLDLSQLENGAIKAEIGEIRLDELFQRIISEFRGLAAAKGLQLKVMPSQALVHSDPRLLERILQNLVCNAVKYTPAGKVLLGVRRRGGRLRLEVWDSGIGIAADQLEAIFEEFYQIGNAARERRFGRGLGLSIAQAAAELLGSRLDVRSVLGKGSVFAVEVPFVRRVAARQPVLQGEHARVGTTTACSAAILLVEDDAAIRSALRTLLELEGYRVAAAASGQEALGLVEQGTCRPALAIVDQNLPGDLCGVATVQRLRRLTEPHLPALVITGDVLPERLAAIRLAGLPHLTKPVNLDELRVLVRSLTGRGQPTPTAPTVAPPLEVGRAAAGSATDEPTVFVVEDDAAQAHSLQSLLATTGRQVETYASAEAFLQAYRPGLEGCLVLDLHLPGMSGLELQRELARRGGGPPCIFVTGQGELGQAVQAMREGAVDFLVKPVRGEALLASVARALDHARQPARTGVPSAAEVTRLGRLTAREREVVELVAAGLANKEVAHRLGISQRTVEGHRARAMRKLGVRTLAELVRLLLAAGSAAPRVTVCPAAAA